MSNREIKNKIKRRLRNKYKIRKKISGTEETPRISVFRSSKHIYVQAISDVTASTLCTASTKDKDVIAKIPSIKSETSDSQSTKSVSAAKAVGIVLAEKLKTAGVEKGVFDRNGYRYHGRIQSVADGVREGGLNL